MWRLDSFLRETRRTRPHADGIPHAPTHGIQLMWCEVLLNRLVLKPTTLSDGTRLTPGTHISAVYSPRESDPRYYPSPLTFDPLRFHAIRTHSQDPSSTRFSSTDIDSNEYLGFGGGRHACPGRFFAVAIIKAAVVQLLLKYDMQPKGEAEITYRFEEQRLPSFRDQVVFRKL